MWEKLHVPFSWLWLVRMAAFNSLAVFCLCETSSNSPTGQLDVSSKANNATVRSNSSRKACCEENGSSVPSLQVQRNSPSKRRENVTGKNMACHRKSDTWIRVMTLNVWMPVTSVCRPQRRDNKAERNSLLLCMDFVRLQNLRYLE